MTNKQIVEAQKLLRILDGTPVKVYNEHGDVFWQVTYSNDAYSALVNVVETVARTPIKEYSSSISSLYSQTTNSVTTPDYHRDKI